MPLYEFQCAECGHTFEKLKPIRDMKVPESEPCPNCTTIGSVDQKVFTAQIWADASRMGIKRPDDGFREVLARVAEKAPGNNIGDKLSRK